jgi:hypothetical protein
MRNDVEFLRQQRLMDYSLLLAIEKTDNSKAELHTESSVARFGMIGFDPSGVSSQQKESKLKQSIHKSIKESIKDPNATEPLVLGPSNATIKDLLTSTNSHNSQGSGANIVIGKIDVGEWMSKKHRF